VNAAASATERAARSAELGERLRAVRAATERLCAPLALDDYGLQSMPEASPVKWHLAHMTWFFETLVLGPHVRGHHPYQEGWAYLFNSYYESLGPRHARPERGLLSRPTVAEVFAYRAAIDEQLEVLLTAADAPNTTVLDLIELGLHH
jgi:hypothetical protein